MSRDQSDKNNGGNVDNYCEGLSFALQDIKQHLCPPATNCKRHHILPPHLFTQKMSLDIAKHLRVGGGQNHPQLRTIN